MALKNVKSLIWGLLEDNRPKKENFYE